VLIAIEKRAHAPPARRLSRGPARRGTGPRLRKTELDRSMSYRSLHRIRVRTVKRRRTVVHWSVPRSCFRLMHHTMSDLTLCCLSQTGILHITIPIMHR